MMGSARQDGEGDARSIRRRLREAGFEAVEEECRRRLAEEPEYDLLHRLLAEAYLSEGWSHFEAVRRDKVREHARAAEKEAKEALRLNPSSSDAHFLLAEAWCMRLSLGNPFDVVKLGRKVGQEYALAVSLDPSNVRAYVSWAAYGKLNAPVSYGGGPDAAIATLEKALELDPSSAEANFWMAVCYERKGSCAEARLHAARAVEAEPGWQETAALLSRLTVPAS